jgi:hypothetical protein
LQEPDRPGASCLDDAVVVDVNRDDDDAGAGLLSAQDARDTQPGDAGQLNIEQDQSRACLLRGPDRFVGIARFRDDLVPTGCFQHPAQPGAKDRMIVDQQHSPCQHEPSLPAIWPAAGSVAVGDAILASPPDPALRPSPHLPHGSPPAGVFATGRTPDGERRRIPTSCYEPERQMATDRMAQRVN